MFSSLFGSDINKKLQTMLGQGQAKLEQGRQELRAGYGQARSDVKAAKADVRAAAETGRRESVAAQQRAETMAKEGAQKMLAQQLITNFGRGNAMSTYAQGAQPAMLRAASQQGLQAGLAGMQQRMQLASQTGGMLAQLGGQQAQLAAGLGQGLMQSRANEAQLIASMQPVMDNTFESLLGQIGGSFAGVGLAKYMGLTGTGAE